MAQSGSIVKCIRGEKGIIEEGAYYTVWEVTQSGNYILEEVTPPDPYDCFDRTRFEDTGENIFDGMIFEDELIPEELALV